MVKVALSLLFVLLVLAGLSRAQEVAAKAELFRPPACIPQSWAHPQMRLKVTRDELMISGKDGSVTIPRGQVTGVQLGNTAKAKIQSSGGAVIWPLAPLAAPVLAIDAIGKLFRPKREWLAVEWRPTEPTRCKAGATDAMVVRMERSKAREVLKALTAK